MCFFSPKYCYFTLNTIAGKILKANLKIWLPFLRDENYAKKIFVKILLSSVDPTIWAENVVTNVAKLKMYYYEVLNHHVLVL